MKENILELFNQFVYIAENLSPTEQWAVIALAFLLLLYLAYRSFGLGAVLGVCLVGFFAYILYAYQPFSTMQETQKNEAARMQLYREEMNKNAIVE